MYTMVYSTGYTAYHILMTSRNTDPGWVSYLGKGTSYTNLSMKPLGFHIPAVGVREYELYVHGAHYSEESFSCASKKTTPLRPNYSCSLEAKMLVHVMLSMLVHVLPNCLPGTWYCSSGELPIVPVE